MQRRIGLTGSIASGKSSVGRLLEARGLPVLDADHFARQLLEPGTATTQVVLQRHPDVRLEQNNIDRAALGQIVFADPSEREWLNGLIHPQVRRCFERSLVEHADAHTIVLMIPLLFEAELTDLCSEIWLVDCDVEQQLERLMLRNALSREDAQARIEAQWPLSRKRQLADVVINNRGTEQNLITQLQALK
ncbi:dephospho-CoA kinase [Synechococcus sp. AH-601-P06]|nr:dephospho-CoA kinase [Synechococcus sp. AH-601-P06]